MRRRYVIPHESTGNRELLFKQGTLRQYTSILPLGTFFSIGIFWLDEDFVGIYAGSSRNKEL